MNIQTAITLAAELLRQALEISELISQAQSENRPLTAMELEEIQHRDNDARHALFEAIERARVEGR